MRTRMIRIVIVATLAIVGTAIGLITTSVGADDSTAKAVIHNAAGQEIGTAKFMQRRGDVLVKADDLDFPGALAPGFKGFHIHANGICDPAAVDPATGATVPFFTAGGHYNPAAATHGSHGGDMPVLLVNANGEAWSRFSTDHFDVDEIVGRAVIVHAAADNYGNVPVGAGATQYTANSTGTTNATATGLSANTGNAAARYACGVIESD
jgi:superoxide dismutase, Cu-Zn family